MDIPKEKRCTCCGDMKPLDKYHKDKNGRLGLKAVCKVCGHAKRKKYHKNNKDKIRQARRKRYLKNADKNIDYSKKHYSENKEAHSEYNKQYRIDNREELIERHKKYHRDNKEYYAKIYKEYMAKPGNADRVREQRRRHREQNREECLKRAREWKQKQKRLNTNYAKSQTIRKTIYTALKRYNLIKSEKSEMLLGCKVIDAMNYLESLGYDKNIHEIDHIVPIRRFDMNNEIHRIVVFNYKNMQPLEKFENKTKHDKLLKGWESIIINICKSLDIESHPILNYVEETARSA